MREKYRKWIEVEIRGVIYGKCREVTRRMKRAFPELERVRGHFRCLFLGDRSHWCLVDPETAEVRPNGSSVPHHSVH